MSAAFTPGPWIAPPYSSVVGMGIVARGGRVVCSIAAAPDLYVLGEQYEKVAEYELRKKRRENPEDDEGIRLQELNLALIRDILAKARGESPHNQSNPKVGA